MANKGQSNPKDTVPSSTYSEDYYLHDCDGFLEFDRTMGRALPIRLRKALELADVKFGTKILDVGCGRGELILHCAIRGADAFGIDYAFAAMNIAKKTIKQQNNVEELSGKINLLQSNSRWLPISENTFDFVFMLDVVEHLHPEELKTTINEIRRVLRPGGRLIVHTMPNLWYYQVGYPGYRLFQKIRGISLPANPRDRWRYSHVHVNEQTPVKLKKMLEESLLKSKVWLFSIHDYKEEKNPLVRFLMIALTRIYPFRWIFCDDIYAIAEKPKF